MGITSKPNNPNADTVGAGGRGAFHVAKVRPERVERDRLSRKRKHPLATGCRPNTKLLFGISRKKIGYFFVFMQADSHFFSYVLEKSR